MSAPTAGGTMGLPGAARSRWRLSRAGITNVYQYENEVLHFAGGRLLLRGVNGSGKSTAMNMLLPFLLTARPGRIDAAGEQSGILKSWMLNGRDDPQPVGYLWIEFERRGEFAVCGCGIKATRQSDKVTTWWFVTSKRPGIDFRLVTAKDPLSAEGLRAALDGDEVFGDRRRPEYRQAVQRRLYGGAPIDQHIGLIHVVRSPRVGDRIDVDLPEHLVEALPQLSEQALMEAAQPLDDLEEHRRNVADLARTSAAIRGILDVYRAYCINDITQRAAQGRTRITTQRGSVRDEKQKQRAAETAAAEVDRLDAVIEGLEETAGRLRSEISALEESPAYREGRQLDALRDFVASLARQRASAAERVAERERRVDKAGSDLQRAHRRSRHDLKEVNVGLAAAAELGARCRVGRRPPGPVTLAESALADAASAEPAGAFDAGEVGSQITEAAGAILPRRADVDTAEVARADLEAAQDRLSRDESALDAASDAADRAADYLAEQNRRLGATRREWADRILSWASEAHSLFRAAGIDAPATAELAAVGSEADDPTSSAFERAGSTLEAESDGTRTTGTAPTTDTDTTLTVLASEADELLEFWREAVLGADFRLSAERSATEEAQALVDELAARTKPEPPRLGWQVAADHCLADLTDFAPHLGDAQRSGLEAALEASGLLSARLIDDTTVELVNGELVVLAGGRVASPLSECLVVTVPQRLNGKVQAERVCALLESISSDMSNNAATAVTTDGAFRVGSLEGRHSKERAEFIGATARGAALDRARQQAVERLAAALAAVARSEAERAEFQGTLDEARRLRQRMPSDRSVISATETAAVAANSADRASAEREAAAERVADTERASIEASNTLQRTAVTLQLPQDQAGLDSVRRDLQDLASGLERCRSRLDALQRSVDDWRDAVGRWQVADDDLRAERGILARVESEHTREQARLITIEDSIGQEYAEVVATRDRCRTELEVIGTGLPETRREHVGAVERRTRARGAAEGAAERRLQAEQACDEARLSLTDALATPGLLEAIAGTDGAPSGPIIAESAGPKGLREVLESVDRLLHAARDVHHGTTADKDDERGAATGGDTGTAGTDGAEDARAGVSSGNAARDGASGTEGATADSVRQSLRQRQADLGAGWDAGDIQPESAMPLIVEVTGPRGKAPLAASVLAVSRQHQEMVSLLDQKQGDALRVLLQGLIAREIAEKVRGAAKLVERMNERLGTVKTAHEVGVRLRWRRSGELDDTSRRMVDLLSSLPDVRTEEDESELRQVLSDRLDDARALQPDVPYRQLIAETLDYKQWHEMAVMVRKPGEKETRLGRNTPLSEGEKKLVTYLPLFAAVAASCDALNEQQGAASDGRPGVARFVVLDDAFAKVSEDNHAKLFGLLVDLDLDLIATSERLWGTHATVPELAITEVVRDAKEGVILLEHYRWDGATLVRPAAA